MDVIIISTNLVVASESTVVAGIATSNSNTWSHRSGHAASDASRVAPANTASSSVNGVVGLVRRTHGRYNTCGDQSVLEGVQKVHLRECVLFRTY